MFLNLAICYFIPPFPRRHMLLTASWCGAEVVLSKVLPSAIKLFLRSNFLHTMCSRNSSEIYPLFRLWNIKVQQTKNCFSQTFSVQARHGSDVMFSICIIPVGWCVSKSTNNIKHHVCLNLGKVFRLRTVVGETNTSKGTF